MAKRKSKPKKKSSILIKTVWILVFIVVALGTFIAGYYIGFDNAKKEIVAKERIKEQKRLSILQVLEEISAKKKSESVNDRLKNVLKKENITETKKVDIDVGAAHEYDSADLPEPPKRESKVLYEKPKLAIIIDDVGVRSQISAIKSLNLPITMSFLPPSKFRPNSNTLAAKENFYMVHLPMEAEGFTKEEPFTLRVSDSQEEISKRIEMIKKLFPKVEYINNHTGSKFTSDELAVNRLVYALDKQHISFIDSRTIASTKVEKVMLNYGKKYMARDIFLDHESSKKYIKSQIKKAIMIAKAHGTAIAIGHPHVNTILAISESKKLFKDVELVLINELY